ncbi:hypothetical protein BYT27DRAFT_7189573 [Phlegmacium glaucopus]|nr:hypothetical protein BYT27DRAFT_7189573 [Phlegmacium glaucopus]
MSTPRPSFYFRWLTRRHLHVSAKVATDSVRLSEPSYSTAEPTLPLEQATRTGSLDVHEPQKRVRRQKTTGPSLLLESKMKDFLDHVESIKDTLGLEDLERYRPDRRPMPTSPEFEEQYNALYDTLINAFTKQQLRVFLKLYGLHLPVKSVKSAHVTMILEDVWSWPSLKKIKQEKIDWTEISHRNFPMDPKQSFLLMGKDGTDLLNLSKKFNVHVALLSNPLSLRVEGLNGALNRFEAYLKNFASDIELEVTSLPSNRTISPETAESISRLSGAYLEFKGDAKLHITFRRSKAESAVVAKRLAVQAAFERLGDSSQAVYLPLPSTSITQPLSSQSYSLYPFFSPQPLPWKIQSRNAFRLRRVGKWLNSDSLPVLQNVNVLAGAGTALSDEGNDVDIRTDLLEKLGKSSGIYSSRTFTASAGHLLVLSSLSEPTTLVPPLRGPQDVSTVLKWAKDYPSRVVFHPSLPKSLMESLPYKQQVLHRFVYVAQPLQKGRSTERSTELATTLTLEIVSKNSAAALSTPKVSCRLGMEAGIDLLIPDRITDLHFSATDSENLNPSQWPEELQSLADQIEAESASPDIPLSFRYGNTEYVLHSNTNVRQNYKTMAEPDPQGSTLPATADFVIESILDSSTNETRTLCKVTCSDHTSDVEWQAFLSKCDWLTQLFEEGEKANGPDMFTVEMEGHAPDRKESLLQRITA